MDPLSIGSAALSIGAKLFGADKDRKAQEETANRNIALQKEFAQSGIQWKVADAKAAGIHPLYALGASTQSFSPVSVGSNNLETMSSVGQDLTRAAQATQTGSGRASAVSQTMLDLQLQRAGLENQILASQLRKLNTSPNPPMPGDTYGIDGQPGSGIKLDPMGQTPATPGAPNLEQGQNPDVGYARTGGGYAVVPGDNVKQRIEDMPVQELQWFIRNNISPLYDQKQYSPPNHLYKLKKGERWYFNPISGEYTVGRYPSSYKHSGVE